MTSITRLQQLNEQATPGPWVVAESRTHYRRRPGGLPAGRTQDVDGDGYGWIFETYVRSERVFDADLIVACRNALPVLLQIATEAEETCEWLATLITGESPNVPLGTLTRERALRAALAGLGES